MILERANQLIEILGKLDMLKPDIKRVFNLIKEVSKYGGTIYTCGNGGSSNCASHLTEELVGKYDNVRPPIKSICFSSNPDLITCIANDFKYKNVFSRQIDCFCSKNDVLIIFTSSGNSKNLLYAIETALFKEVPIVVFSGKDGGFINKTYKDKINQIIINSENGGLIQEIHLHLIHSLVEYLEHE
jgi:phosphoheptose isomerase